MSVGFLKRLFALLNVAAVLILAGSAYGFWSNRVKVADADPPLKFVPDEAVVAAIGGSIRNISLPFGRFPKVEEKVEGPVKPVEETLKIEDAIAKLGQIKGATVVYPPYDYARPSIVFEFKDGTIKTIGLNEALEEKKHPDPALSEHFMVPAAYQFIGCVPDDQHPGWTYFRFDMQCDGSNIQKARWKLDQPIEALPEAAQATPGVQESSSKNIWVGSPDRVIKEYVPAKPKETPTEAPVQPVPTQPTSPSRPGKLTTMDGDAFTTTNEGARYLKENYDTILKDAKTTTYKDSRTGRTGVLVTGIRPGSAANDFGIRADDVILAINGRPVKDQKQAVRLVKQELNKKPRPRYIEVKILRNGREVTQKYDTQDPETRRKVSNLRR